MATRLTKEEMLTVSLLIGNLILYKNCEHEHSKSPQGFAWKIAIYMYIYTSDLHLHYICKLCVPFLKLSINYIELHCYA